MTHRITRMDFLCCFDGHCYLLRQKGECLDKPFPLVPLTSTQSIRLLKVHCYIQNPLGEISTVLEPAWLYPSRQMHMQFPKARQTLNTVLLMMLFQ